VITLTSLEEITFELAREGLREQAHDVDTLRSRAGTLLAVGLAAMGLLAEPAVERTSGIVFLLAVAGFAAGTAAIGFALSVMRTRHVGFVPDVVNLYESAVADGDALDYYLRLAVTLRELGRLNEPLTRRAHRWFGWSIAMVVLEIVALTTAIGIR
jgi:NADH:ubiquinone oxidoreductase subunit K